MNRTNSIRIFEENRKRIPGGVVSLNRAVEPTIVFVRGNGSRVWDADGNEYIDYHAGFAPYVLGHNDADVNAAVQEVLASQGTLMGSGPTSLEGRLAELVCECVPSVEQVQFTNTGSEASYHAVRIARAHTGRNGIIVMQGGYNGWHNDVAVNVMTPLDVIGPRVSPGEYKVVPISAGIPEHVLKDIHVVNFNDLESVEHIARNGDIGCILLEPILQNIGIVLPEEGYLQGLRKLCSQYGIVLIFDEVKTGFRHALGGYQSVCGVMPDLCIFGKAIANGYPLGAIGGRKEFMQYFVHPDPAKKVLIAGTYNAHPIPVAAAIATVEKLARNDGQAYERLYASGEKLQQGLTALFEAKGITATLVRQGSAFCVYFMDHQPRDWHDVAEYHDMGLDVRYRKALIEEGIYHFPLATKQGSISVAHTDADIGETLSKTEKVLGKL
ncbi:MAG: aspartate aminotransferase family protein [Planctomycetota bacterium]|nr:aspartate aminotransferase family protein [Planctomycetota bacterium]